MTRLVIALGSNLGDRLGNLRAAVRLLAERGIAVEAASSIWETAPVPADQPAFLNAVVTADTDLAPEDLLTELKAIEYELGRRPARHWGPRPADLDILFYGDLSMDTEALTIPHPRIAERPFVLAPLGEVTGGPLPVLGQTALELLAGAGTAGLIRTAHALTTND
jgi:2-amino-4-hydroxy-6-hydroxymethyldihydropteridine diphosphokinase